MLSISVCLFVCLFVSNERKLLVKEGWVCVLDFSWGFVVVWDASSGKKKQWQFNA